MTYINDPIYYYYPGQKADIHFYQPMEGDTWQCIRLWG